MSGQYEERFKLKKDEATQRRERELDERRKIEESVKLANEADKRKKEDRRRNFISMTEEDLNQKRLRKSDDRAAVNRMGSAAGPDVNDFFSKVFD